MRTLKISLLVFILSITISAQWYQQNSGTIHWLGGVCFTDQNNGTAVGGVILRTTDGGTNWFSQTFPPTSLMAVSFTDANTGTIVGSQILRTTNGGTTWTLQTIPTNQVMWGVSFSDADNGTAVGRNGTIIRTTNGGTTWILQANNLEDWFNGVCFTDPNNGTAVGDWGTILRTTNGGMNWINQNSGTSEQLWGVSFTDANNGTVVGSEGIILRTTNGGETWVSQTSGTTNYLGGVSFTDTNNGTVVGDNGTILRTTNGGTTWTLQISGTMEWLRGVSFTDQNTGTAVGDNGIILRTTNGGTPVELISFVANYINNENIIKLDWSTATETNNSGFEILRFAQKDNDEWNKIGFVRGHGTTTETQHYYFTDNDVKPGKYQYKLKQIDYDGTFEYSQIVEVEIPFVNEFSLSQNYPNPFNPVTKIKYQIPLSPPLLKGESEAGGFVTLKVYDVLGREVATLVNEEIRQGRTAGEYEVEFNAANLPSGVYFYQLKAGEFTAVKKMILLK